MGTGFKSEACGKTFATRYHVNCHSRQHDQEPQQQQQQWVIQHQLPQHQNQWVQQQQQQQHWQQQLQQQQQWIQQQQLVLQQQQWNKQHQQQHWNQQQQHWNQKQDQQQQQHRNTIEDALRGNLRAVTLYPNVRDMYGIFHEHQTEIIHYIMQYLVKRGLIYYFKLQVKCNKEKDREKIYASAHFWCNFTIVLNNDHVEIDLSQAHQKYLSLLTHMVGRVVGGCLTKLPRLMLD